MAPHEDLNDLRRWSATLAGIAQTGLAFTKSLFEIERFEEVLHVAADIEAAAALREGRVDAPEPEERVVEWLGELRPGIEGYATPKVAVAALVGDDAGRLLLIQRQDSGAWLYPTGWADVGYSAAELVVKEVREETGIDVEPVRIAMVLDGIRVTLSRIPLYSIVFHCRAIGGELRHHPLECLDAGFFTKDQLPEPLAIRGVWADHAFRIISGEETAVYFDWPRSPAWRGEAPGSS